jgi:hypothetical protein
MPTHPDLQRQSGLVDDPVGSMEEDVARPRARHGEAESQLLVAALGVVLRCHGHRLLLQVGSQAERARPGDAQVRRHLRAIRAKVCTLIWAQSQSNKVHQLVVRIYCIYYSAVCNDAPNSHPPQR